MKKKILIAAICACLMLFSACGDNQQSSSVPSSPSSSASTTPDTTPDAAPDTTPDAQPDESDSQTPDSDSESSSGSYTLTDSDSISPLVVGTIDGYEYRNIYLDVSCVLDDNWVFLSQEEIASLNGYASEMFSSEEYKQMLAESNTFFDMYAMTIDGMANINVTIEKIGIATALILTEESYVDAVISVLEEALVDAGYEDLSCATAQLDFGGKTHTGISTYGVLQGVPIYQKQICFIVSEYVATITLTSYDEDYTDYLMSLFSEIGA